MESKIWIKICGLAEESDILACADADINAVGFLLSTKPYFDNNRDKLTLNRPKELIEFTQGIITSCLLIHDDSVIDTLNKIKMLKPEMIQIQSSLDTDALLRIRELNPDIEISKSFSIPCTEREVNYESIASSINNYVEHRAVDYVILDTKNNSGRGGTGSTHDWAISKRLVNDIDSKFILAGGLKPSNICLAIHQVRPFGIDVMSGVSISRGVKDHRAIADLARSARHE